MRLSWKSTMVYGLFLTAVTATRVNVHGRISFDQTICRGIEELGPAKVVLDDGSFSGGITKEGVFVIPDVPEGAYVLKVDAHSHSFDQLRVDVVNSTVEVHPYILGTPFDPPSPFLLTYPISLLPRHRHQHFIPLAGFNLLGMFQNPMMLLMGATALLMLATPFITSQLMEAEPANERQNKLNGGLPSLLASGPGKAAPLAPKPSPSTPGKARSKGKRR